MDNECCGSLLYHTGVCCNEELISKALNSVEQQPLKNCACRGLGPCQCPPKTKEDNDFFERVEDIKYVVETCGCGKD